MGLFFSAFHPVKCSGNSSTAMSVICILVPYRHVKVVKEKLELHKKLDKSMKIVSICNQADSENYFIESTFRFRESLRVVPTSHVVNTRNVENVAELLYISRADLARDLGLEALLSDISFAAQLLPTATPSSTPSTAAETSPRGLLAQSVQQWLLQLPAELRFTLPLSIPKLTSLGSWTYTVYPPLVLLPASSFRSEPWPSLLAGSLAPHIPALYALICAKLQVTHIAVNAPIPLLGKPGGCTENTLRAPVAFTPLHGLFGTLDAPSAAAFAAAFWVSTRQHGVYQTWAPLYTMFSRGNISEKARILGLPELKEEVLGCPPDECSAVDLYAGIGYFAFYYAKARIRTVLCWEINAWSVEGLRRGAKKNGWTVRVDGADKGDDEGNNLSSLIVFQEDNQKALGRIEATRSHIAPIRHVNCGFLPTSAKSWSIAVNALDPIRGGWVHAHENIAITDVAHRTAEIVKTFQRLAKQTNAGRRYSVKCQHVEHVKSYAPGVMHCVLDIHIYPTPPTFTPAMKVTTS